MPLAVLVPLVAALAPIAEAVADPGDELPGSGSSLVLPLFYIDSADLQDGTLRALKEEVAAKLAEIGVTVREIDPEGMSSGANIPSGFHLGVMLLSGQTNGWGHGGNTIGISSRQEPKPGYNTVYLFVPEVEQTLEACAVRPFPSVVGKGAGRAAVHEIVHTLVPALEHSDIRMDIMAPSWTCNALLKDNISLNAEFAEAVRNKLQELLEA